MDDKVLQNLITLYRSKGVPLDSIVNSELFKSLPVDKKLQVIKAVGSQSQDKIKTINSSDVKKILLGLGLGVLGGMYMLNTANVFSAGVRRATEAGLPMSSVPLPSFALVSGASAATAGGISNLVNSYRNVSHKNSLKRMDTSDSNSILHYLSERDRYVSA